MVIADSSVWITYLRRPRSETGRHFDSLLAGDEVIMVGPVITEILQGARSESEFEFFAERLKSLPFIEVDQNTWTLAGEINLQLRLQGNMMGFADLILATIAIQHGMSVYTEDGDYDRVPGLQLYEAE